MNNRPLFCVFGIRGREESCWAEEEVVVDRDTRAHNTSGYTSGL